LNTAKQGKTQWDKGSDCTLDGFSGHWRGVGAEVLFPLLKNKTKKHAKRTVYNGHSYWRMMARRALLFVQQELPTHFFLTLIDGALAGTVQAHSDGIV
jgi:hypothetical protein